MDVGCGRFFGGTPAEMHKALNETLAALPDDTKVYVRVGECQGRDKSTDACVARA